MENLAPFVIKMFVVYLLLALIMIIITARSPIAKDKKIVVYILSFLAPVIGLVIFLIFRYSEKRNATV